MIILRFLLLTLVLFVCLPPASEGGRERERSRSPRERYQRERSRSPGERYQRERSRSPEERYQRKRSPSPSGSSPPPRGESHHDHTYPGQRRSSPRTRSAPPDLRNSRGRSSSPETGLQNQGKIFKKFSILARFH